MKIGVVSDSHGKSARLRRALAILTDRGAEAVVHCGDLGATDCLEALAEAGVPAYAVAGNMDRNRQTLQAEAQRLGVHFSCDTILVCLGGGTYLAATHGDRSEVIQQLLADRQFPYVCHGHTHRPRNQKLGGTRIINPGALHHAHRHTAALLDTEADTAEHVSVE